MRKKKGYASLIVALIVIGLLGAGAGFLLGSGFFHPTTTTSSSVSKT